MYIYEFAKLLGVKRESLLCYHDNALIKLTKP